MRFVFLVMLFVMAACQSTEPPVRSKLLNIDSLLNTQAKLLGTVSLDKTLKVENSEFKIQARSVQLLLELEPFREISQMNRPIYQNNYLVSVHPDTQSNLTVKEFHSKDYAPVKTLRLFYLDNLSQLKRLEATLATEDFYQSSERNLSLDFSLLGDTMKLESYSISGSQRYFWSVPQHFLVKADIH
jgi:hypothetical protein